MVISFSDSKINSTLSHRTIWCFQCSLNVFVYVYVYIRCIIILTPWSILKKHKTLQFWHYFWNPFDNALLVLGFECLFFQGIGQWQSLEKGWGLIWCHTTKSQGHTKTFFHRNITSRNKSSDLFFDNHFFMSFFHTFLHQNSWIGTCTCTCTCTNPPGF